MVERCCATWSEPRQERSSHDEILDTAEGMLGGYVHLVVWTIVRCREVVAWTKLDVRRRDARRISLEAVLGHDASGPDTALDRSTRTS